MWVSASGRFSQSLTDRADQDLSLGAFDLNLADRQTDRAGISTTLSLGSLSVSQNVDLNRRTTKEVPVDFFDPGDPLPLAGLGSVGDLQRSVLLAQSDHGFRDFGDEELTWSTSINYRGVEYWQ